MLFLSGMCAMYAPTLWDAAHTLWNSDEQAHGPLVILVSLWWFWNRRHQLVAQAEPARGPWAWLLLAGGTVMYAAGRTQHVWLLEIGSAIAVLHGGLAILYGWRAVRTVRFGIWFLLFAVPLPAFVVDELTWPLKQWVSVVADEVLYRIGLPSARDGVVLSLGQYKLLIADACSGLYSMTSLLALAVVYVSVVRKASLGRNVTILLASLPFAFVANVLRVVLLALITYTWGDAAGQGFLHGTAAAVMFATSLSLLMAADALLSSLARRTGAPDTTHA